LFTSVDNGKPGNFSVTGFFYLSNIVIPDLIRDPVSSYTASNENQPPRAVLFVGGTMSLTREELIRRLQWYGVIMCVETWAAVAILGPVERYTDEELSKLLKFQEEFTQPRIRARWFLPELDVVVIGKNEDGTWQAKTLEDEIWTPLPSLDQALAEYHDRERHTHAPKFLPGGKKLRPL
jgi:hypothetical protein